MLRLGIRYGRGMVQTLGGSEICHPLKNVAFLQTRQVWMEWTWLHNNGKDEEDDDEDTKEESQKEKKTEQKSSLPSEQSQHSRASK